MAGLLLDFSLFQCMHACSLSLLVLFREGNDLQQSRDGEKSKEDQCLEKNTVSEEQQ